MVKYGQCYIRCTYCGKGCGVETQIQRDKGWEYNAATQRCEHFMMKIDLYTHNSFVPWGDSDRIRFEASWTPLGGGSPGYLKAQKSSTNDGDEYHESGCKAEMHWRGNGFLDILGNIAEGVVEWAVLGVAGAVVAPIVIRGEYLTTVKF